MGYENLRSAPRRAAADAVVARNGYDFGGSRLRVEHAHRGEQRAAFGGSGYGGGYGAPMYGGGYGGGMPPRGGCALLYLSVGKLREVLKAEAFAYTPKVNDHPNQSCLFTLMDRVTGRAHIAISYALS